jgi:hypothetical protein
MPARASRITIKPQGASFRMASVPTSAARAIRVSLTKSTIRRPAGVNRIRLSDPRAGDGLGHRYDAVDDPAGGFEEALRVLIRGQIAEVVGLDRTPELGQRVRTEQVGHDLVEVGQVFVQHVRRARSRRVPQQLFPGPSHRDDGKRLIGLQVVRDHGGHVGDHRVRGVEAVLDRSIACRRRAPQVLATGSRPVRPPGGQLIRRIIARHWGIGS